MVGEEIATFEFVLPGWLGGGQCPGWVGLREMARKWILLGMLVVFVRGRMGMGMGLVLVLVAFLAFLLVLHPAPDLARA